MIGCREFGCGEFGGVVSLGVVAPFCNAIAADPAAIAVAVYKVGIARPVSTLSLQQITNPGSYFCPSPTGAPENETVVKVDGPKSLAGTSRSAQVRYGESGAAGLREGLRMPYILRLLVSCLSSNSATLVPSPAQIVHWSLPALSSNVSWLPFLALPHPSHMRIHLSIPAFSHPHPTR